MNSVLQEKAAFSRHASAVRSLALIQMSADPIAADFQDRQQPTGDRRVAKQDRRMNATASQPLLAPADYRGVNPDAAAMSQLAEQFPEWFMDTEHTDWLSCSVEELLQAHESAPHPYLRGMLSGVLLARRAMESVIKLQAQAKAHAAL